MQKPVEMEMEKPIELIIRELEETGIESFIPLGRYRTIKQQFEEDVQDIKKMSAAPEIIRSAYLTAYQMRIFTKEELHELVEHMHQWLKDIVPGYAEGVKELEKERGYKFGQGDPAPEWATQELYDREREEHFASLDDSFSDEKPAEVEVQEDEDEQTISWFKVKHQVMYYGELITTETIGETEDKARDNAITMIEDKYWNPDSIHVTELSCEPISEEEAHAFITSASLGDEDDKNMLKSGKTLDELTYEVDTQHKSLKTILDDEACIAWQADGTLAYFSYDDGYPGAYFAPHTDFANNIEDFTSLPRFAQFLRKNFARDQYSMYLLKNPVWIEIENDTTASDEDEDNA
jgi:hypothetical protein